LKTLTEEELKYYSIPTHSSKQFNKAIEAWGSAGAIEGRNAVALSPIDSIYHGKADENIGIVFNEALLLEGRRRDLAETSLHEIAHFVSGYRDYTEEFVGLLYELAHHLASAKTASVKT
ncbi:MAG: hypothetical protein AAB597_01285, partial [Patescibacteria group bacterium]